MTVIKNMAYWKAKSGDSPLKAEDTVKPVKASSLTTEQQIALAEKKFGGGVKVQPKERYTDIHGKVNKSVDSDARKIFYNRSYSGKYKGSLTYGGLDYKEKHKLRTQALKALKKRRATKK